MKSLLVSCLLFAAIASAKLYSASSNQVTSLPGFNGPFPAAMYSGYVTVDATNGRKLFYVFTESQNKPATDPLVLWLTGGPGCSSLSAFLGENGMFQMNFNDMGNGIEVNPWSWNKVANVVYLESPAGVGFSKSNVSGDYITGDARTANDTYAFLQGFLQEFTQFRQSDFWVTGESYGGHYIPEIVNKIRDMNPTQSPDQVINIKGFMAGNPWTDPESEAFGVTDNWWQRAMISEQVYTDINTYCTYRDITHWIINNVSAATLYSTLNPHQPAGLTPQQQKCYAALVEGSLVQFGGVNILGVYLDVCNKGTKGNIPDQPNYCSDGQMATYLNRPDVQAAMHVENAPVQWNFCSSVVQYNQEDTQTSVLPLYQKFLAAGDMRILVYSGDNDAIVPTTGTRRWLRVLDLPIVKDTHQWFVNTNGPQVGGWAVQYDGLLFTTVRDAGHMVPFMQPERAFFMFNTFLNGGTL